MNEKLNDGFEQVQELIKKFKELDDSQVANSILTAELFDSGQTGEDEIYRRIEEIKIEAVKNDAKFRVAKLYYENKNDLESALNVVEEISDPNEQTRCLVHLAIAAINNKGDLRLADEIVARAKTDDQGYLKFYQEERGKIPPDQEPDDLVFTD